LKKMEPYQGGFKRHFYYEWWGKNEKIAQEGWVSFRPTNKGFQVWIEL